MYLIIDILGEARSFSDFTDELKNLGEDWTIYKLKNDRIYRYDSDCWEEVENLTEEWLQ